MAESRDVIEEIEEEIIEEEPQSPPTLRDHIDAAYEELGDPAEDEKAEPEQKTDSSESTDETKGDEEPEPEPLKPPTSWSREDREHWESLSRPLQEVVLRRESERDRGTQQRLEEATKLQRRYQELDDVLTPYQQQLGLKGQTPAQLVRAHLAAEELMSKDPVAGITWFCRHYGVTPEQLLNGQAEQPKVDPQVQALTQEISQLKGYFAQQQQQAQLEQTKSLKAEIESFASEKDVDGNLKRPYWEDVKEQLPSIINLVKAENPQAGPRSWLETAYQKAIRLDDTVWQKELEAQRAKEQAEQAQKVQAAKRASGSISGAPTGGNSKGDRPKHLRGIIDAAFDGRL